MCKFSAEFFMQKMVKLHHQCTNYLAICKSTTNISTFPTSVRNFCLSSYSGYNNLKVCAVQGFFTRLNNKRFLRFWDRSFRQTWKQRIKSPGITATHSVVSHGSDRWRTAVAMSTHSSSSDPNPANLTRTSAKPLSPVRLLTKVDTSYLHPY